MVIKVLYFKTFRSSKGCDPAGSGKIFFHIDYKRVSERSIFDDTAIDTYLNFDTDLQEFAEIFAAF
jgi:hypothetical protein